MSASEETETTKNKLRKVARAFLSHSSLDKPLVENVAKHLGRHRAVYDRWNFEAGANFIEAIKKEIPGTDLFVLFASRAALDSIWVRYEHRLAEELNASRTKDNALVLLTDQWIKPDELPDWLTRLNAVFVRNYNEATFRINRALYRLDAKQGDSRLIGRTNEYSILESAIIAAPNGGSVFSVVGLRGIGRQSMAIDVANRFFRLHGQVSIEIDDNDSLPEILAKMAQEAAVFSSGDQLVDLVSSILDADDDLLSEVLRDYLRRIGETNRLLIIRDNGGLLSPGGNVSHAVRQIIELNHSEKLCNISLIGRRTIADRDLQIPSLRLSEMSDSDMRKLLTYLLRDGSERSSENLLADLVQYVHGYPPAAYVAAGLVRDYGADLVKRDKRQITEFQAVSLISALRRDGVIDGQRSAILSTLVAYSPLPFPVLESLISGDLSSDLMYLRDYGIVSIDESGYYLLARPMEDAVARTIGYANVDHALVARALKQYVDESEGQEPSVPLYRCLYRAVTFSRIAVTSKFMIGLISDMESVQQRLYHRRMHAESRDLGLLILDRRPDSFDARRYLVRAYAQIGDYRAAHESIGALNRRHQAEIAYLKAFVARYEGKLQDSLRFLGEAQSLGRDDVSIYRDIAFVKFTLGDTPGTLAALDKASERDPTNPFVVDFKVQIALNNGDMNEVDRLMQVLQQVDAPDHFLHRESDVAYVRGEYEVAFEKAKQSLQTLNPPLYFYSQLIKTEIELRRFHEADQAIAKLDADFPHLHHDIKVGLRIKLLTKQGRFMNALALCDRLHSKANMVHRALKRNALVGYLSTLDVADPRRRGLEAEIAATGISPAQARLA